MAILYGMNANLHACERYVHEFYAFICKIILIYTLKAALVAAIYYAYTQILKHVLYIQIPVQY